MVVEAVVIEVVDRQRTLALAEAGKRAVSQTAM